MNNGRSVIAFVVGACWALLLSALIYVAILGASTHGAVCTLRTDLVQRHDESVKFLASHPNGIPGIPAAQIQQSITNQGRTIKALSSLWGC